MPLRQHRSSRSASHARDARACNAKTKRWPANLSPPAKHSHANTPAPNGTSSSHPTCKNHPPTPTSCCASSAGGYAADKDADISITSIKATVARRAHARRKRVYRGRDDADDLAWKDLCFAVIGNRHDRWYASRHAHSLQNVFPAADEERTEKFIRIGRRVEEQKRVAA
jgi:hypothetical protein